MDDARRDEIAALLARGEGALDALVHLCSQLDREELAVLADHPAEVVRRAVVGVLGAVADSWTLWERFVRDGSEAVRQDLAKRAAADASAPAPLVAQLLEDDDDEVRRLVAKRGWESGLPLERLARIVLEDTDWRVRQALVQVADPAEHPERVPLLLQSIARESDFDVQLAAARLLEPLDAPFEALVGQLGENDRTGLRRWSAGGRAFAERLKAALEASDDGPSDGSLARFGTDLTARARAGALPRAHLVDDAVAAIAGSIERGEGRSHLVWGAAGVGKSAVVNEVVHRLAEAERPWRVLMVRPSEILSGTKYLGEWETKVRGLMEVCSAKNRVVLFVPNAEQLSMVGRTSNDESNVATMLAPSIERGELVMIGETTAEGLRTGLGADASLARLFVPVEIAAASEARTRDVLQLVALEAGVELSGEVADRVAELAQLFATGVELPGRAVGLLRRVLEDHPGEEPDPARVLATVQRSTGVPRHLLDDELALELGEVTRFFERRVMGQSEAVSTIVDRVALVKAGLTDPARPHGVFLFVGPTGVGKTELARALAEFLFGDAGRLVRLDMSEYASYDSFNRLLGAGSNAGTLTEPVRRNPFCVVLLDEIEKAHVNVFDLCLQLFDAGRLTDAGGRTVDFRNTIVVLTSNAGAAVRTDAGLGFGGTDGDDRSREALRETIGRELAQLFRPEFLGRVDSVVHFDPLTRDTAQALVRREVRQVLERSGIARRNLLVDVDAGVAEALLTDGYTRAFGARPLKRAVERHVLLPLARAIAGGEVRSDALLRLEREDDATVVRVLEAGAPVATAPHRPGPQPATLRESEDGAARLRADVEELVERAAPVRARRAELVERTADGELWSSHAEALALFDRLHRLERVLDQLEWLERESAVTAANADADRAGRFVRDQRRAWSRIARLVDAALASEDAPGLGDALVWLRTAAVRGEGQGATLALARAFVRFAERQRFEVLLVHDGAGPLGGGRELVLAIAGAGAAACFEREDGLHAFVRGAGRSRGRETVDVITGAWTGEGDLARVRARRVAGEPGALGRRVEHELLVVGGPLDGFRARSQSGTDEARSAVLDLAPLVAAARAGGARRLVRTYRFGDRTEARDRISHASTPRVDRVLDGELERTWWRAEPRSGR